jgi:hypothetical protein
VRKTQRTGNTFHVLDQEPGRKNKWHSRIEFSILDAFACTDTVIDPAVGYGVRAVFEASIDPDGCWSTFDVPSEQVAKLKAATTSSRIL